MSERETTRLIAWSTELRRVHGRLRDALAVVLDELDDPALDDPERAAAVGRDLLVFCHGFCTALDTHHRGEDAMLFPALAGAHPELAPVLRSLQQDHSMIAHLLGGLQAALSRAASPAELQQHVDGIAAVMESHFRYEERMLLTVLESLELQAEVDQVLGPL